MVHDLIDHCYISVSAVISLFKFVIQVSLLSDYSRLQFEYSSLVYQTAVCEDDVEVLIGSCSTHIKSRLVGGAVNFLICLKIDFSNLPPLQTGEDSGESAAVLLVTFHPPEGS